MLAAKRLVITTAALALCAAPVLAQGADGGKLSVGVVAGLYTLGGDDFDGIKAGVHFEGTLRYLVSPQISLGVGAGYNMNSTETSGVNFNVIRVPVQVRYLIKTSDPKLAPWLGAQAEFHRYSSSYSGIDVHATGFGFGGLAGATYWMSPTFGLEVSASFNSIQFGDLTANGASQSGTNLSGTALGLQAGVVFRPR